MERGDFSTMDSDLRDLRLGGKATELTIMEEDTSYADDDVQSLKPNAQQNNAERMRTEHRIRLKTPSRNGSPDAERKAFAMTDHQGKMGGPTKDFSSASSSNLQFSMDTIVRQIRDDIIARCTKIRERVSQMRTEEKLEAGIVPEEYREDLEKRLADLMIVGERSGLSRYKLCVYELECHFHIKIAMVHLEGPTDSLDKAVQLYRMGQFSEALPMLQQQLERSNCYLHELIASSMFNLGRIDDAGYHYQQAVKFMESRPAQDRTVKTDKQQSNLSATARNAKAKAGESLKNKQHMDAQRFYDMANDLYSAIESRREGIEGMVLCIGGQTEVIQALSKSQDPGSPDARIALRTLLSMYERLESVLESSGLEDALKNQCLGMCTSLLGSAYENVSRFMPAIRSYKDAMDFYNLLPDDKIRILRMRECITKARHVIRALMRAVGSSHPEVSLPSVVQQAMIVLLQMHGKFMTESDKAEVDTQFRAENQAECLNSIGIGHYELRQFEQAEVILQRGVDIMKQKFGVNCRHVILAQLQYNLGLLYQDIGQLVKARGCFEDARALYNRIEDMDARDEGIRKTQEALQDIE